jgi:hypothetical protein
MITCCMAVFWGLGHLCQLFSAIHPWGSACVDVPGAVAGAHADASDQHILHGHAQQHYSGLHVLVACTLQRRHGFTTATKQLPIGLCKAVDGR